MARLGAYRNCVESLRRQLQSCIVAEVKGAGGLEDCAGARVPGTPHGVSRFQGLRKILHLLFSPENSRRIHDRIGYLLVPGASAGCPVGLEPVTDLFAGRVEVCVQQTLGGDNESGGTESALDCPVGNESPLDRVEMVGSPHSLYRQDVRILGDFAPGCYAGSGYLAVQDDVAGPALPLSASQFCACQVELFSNHADQFLFRVRDNSLTDTVDHHGLHLVLYGHILFPP